MVNRQSSFVLYIVVFCAHVVNGLKIKMPLAVKPDSMVKMHQRSHFLKSKKGFINLRKLKPNLNALKNTRTKQDTIEETKPGPSMVEKSDQVAVKPENNDGNKRKSRFKASDIAAAFSILILPVGLIIKKEGKFAIAVLIIAIFMGLLATYHKWYLVGWKLGHKPSTNTIILCILTLLTIPLCIGIGYKDKHGSFTVGVFTTLLIANIPYQILLVSFTSKNPLYIRIPMLLLASVIGGLIFHTEKLQKKAKRIGIAIISAWMFVGGIDHFGARLQLWKYMPMSPEPKGYFFRNPKVVFENEPIHAIGFAILWLILTAVSYVVRKADKVEEVSTKKKSCCKK